VRWVGLVCFLCGCNALYGLERTDRVDAAFFDAPPRPAAECPSRGFPLQFAPALTQLALDCISPVETTDRVGYALCAEGDLLYHPYTGSLDGTLAPLADVPRSSAMRITERIRISPEGTLLVLVSGAVTAPDPSLHTYRHDGTWKLTSMFQAALHVSTLSRGPDHRIMITRGHDDVRELSHATGEWKEVLTHRRAVLEVQSAESLWLSADGLRMIFVADRANQFDVPYLAQVERASLTDEFGPALRLTAPVSSDPFITEDCGRMYFSGLRSLFYAEQ
jgi:hypothetical protein